MDYLKLLLSEYSVKIGLILLLLLLGLQWYISNTYSYWTRKGVPGPPVVPFLGNFFSISIPIPLLQIDYLKKYGKFYGVYHGGTPGICISDPTIVKRILITDFRTFHEREDYNGKDLIYKSLLMAKDDKWKRARSLVSKMFTASKLRRMQHLIMQCSDSMLEHLEELADNQRSFLAHEVTSKFTLDVMAKCAFATDLKTFGKGDNPFIMEAKTWFHASMLIAILWEALPQKILEHIESWFPNSHQGERLETLGFHLVKQRKTLGNQSPHADILQLLIDARHGDDDDCKEDGQDLPDDVNSNREDFEQEKKYLSNLVGPKFLSEEEIVANIVMFLLAGYGTTSTLLKFLFYELAVNPEVQQKLFEEIKMIVDQGKPLDHDTLGTLPYLNAVIMESLRAHPSTVHLRRIAAQEYYIPEYNYTMEKGQGVLIPVYAIHYDPDYYENPDQFNPERFMPENRGSIVPGSYLPFGAGPRNCVGMRFAILEAKIALANIVNKFVLCKTEQTTLEIGFGYNLLETSPIYVGIKRRT